MEDIREIVERLSMKAITSKVEAKNYPNCIVLKKDLIAVLNRLEQLEKENIDKLKAIQELGRDFEIIQHEHDILDKRNNELIEENKRLEQLEKENAIAKPVLEQNARLFNEKERLKKENKEYKEYNIRNEGNIWKRSY